MSNPYAPPSGDEPSRREPPVPTPPGPPPPAPVRDAPAQHGRVSPAKRPAPDPEAVKRTSRHVMHFGLLMLSALLVSSLTLPWQAASALFAIAALVQGVRALRSAWTSGLRGAILPMLMVGIGAASLLIIGTIGTLALWPVQMERQTCLRDALTISSQDQCEANYRTSLESVRARMLDAKP